MKYILSLMLFFICRCVFAQVAINTTGNSPALSAMLEVSSPNKGLLIPRMTSAQRKAITSPDTGLLVFDTDRQTIYFFDGQKWKPMMVATEETAPLASRQVQGARWNAQFGYAADLFENRAAVGAPADSAKGTIGGAVYLFEKNSGHWEQTVKLSAPLPLAGEGFGKAVALNDDYLVVGAPNKTVSGNANRGAVYLFKRFNRVWNYLTTLTASNGAASDYFGTAVSISNGYIAIGAPHRNHNGKTNAGSVYIFGLQSGNWVQKAVINASDPYNDATFGAALDLDGNRLAVGAPAAEAFANNVSGNGGAVYTFTNTDAAGLTWTSGQKLTPGGYTHSTMKFGYSLALEGTKLLIGAPGYSGSPGIDYPMEVGTIFWYDQINGKWDYKSHVLQYNEDHQLGTSVALSNGTMLAGMPGSIGGNGKVVILTSPYRHVYDADPHLKYGFGTAIAAHNGQFLVTKPKDPFGRVFFGLVEE
jgi:hypothetical protein